MKSAFPLLFVLASCSFAQNVASSSGEYSYEERPGVGLYFEMGQKPSKVHYEYKISQKPFDLEYDVGHIYGLGAHLPLSSWFGINGFIGMQQIDFDYSMRGDSADQNALLDSFNLTSDDLEGDMKSRNLLVQVGFETGVPLYTNYKHQLMFKALVFADGIYGKTFFDDSKFTNANLWGYAYGGALRMALGPVALEGGVRLSHIYWRTYFDPAEQTGEQAKYDTFMFDYDSPISPFFKAVWSLY